MMRERWACPDLALKREEGYFLPVPGAKYEFDDCPAYYLRTATMGLPAVHLIEGTTHPAQLVSEYAFEIETGSRNVETLSPKVRELVHLWFEQKRAAREYEEENRKKARH